MPQENVEVVRGVFDAVGSGDVDGLVGLTDPAIEWHSFFALGEAGEYHGHDGLRQYMADLTESWETLRPVLDDLLAVGEVVVGVGRIEYRGKGSGVETEAPAGWLFKLRAGKVVRFRAFRDPDAALEDVGLSP